MPMEIDEIVLKNSDEMEKYFSPNACKTKNAYRFKKERRKNEFNVRPTFFRDADRILHSGAYACYMDKTQVFPLINNDLITHRGLHVQFVSKIARTIGRSLKLNEDLIEAIGLGHDLGHAPFGHMGERCLNVLSQKYGLGLFLHNAQSVRVLNELENKGNGLNITVQVLDGILCHNGEFLCRKYEPNYEKTPEQFFEEYKRTWLEKGFDKTLRPMTLEGCVVRISDVIAYIGRDIEDAIAVNLIKREDIPSEITDVLGNKNSEIIDSLVEDLIYNSFEKPYLEFSKEVFTALKKLLDFNYKYIYSNPRKEDKEEKFICMFDMLYNALLEDIKNKEGRICEVYLSKMNRKYIKETSNERIAIDYIAGMTDDYFMTEYKIHFLPRRRDLTVDEV